MNADSKNMVFSFGNLEYDFSSRTFVMGVLNVTPDSFSDGGEFVNPDRAVARAVQMEEEGADFVDIGGESSRPGADSISIEEEMRRVLPVIERLEGRISIPISIDTCKSQVAAAALSAGAVMINDITGLTHDDSMVRVAARHQASIVIMHMQGTPRDMQREPSYRDVVAEVTLFLRRRAEYAATNGVSQIIVDPGIGFGKEVEHNLELIRNLSVLRELRYPVLMGPSRKSFIGKLLDLPVTERLEGTAAAVTACILNGASIVRVHDVREMKRVAVVADALRKNTAS